MLQQGLWENVKKAVITKLPWREYENLLFETVDVF